MIVIKWFLVIVAFVIAACCQIRYAQSGYPRERAWRQALFVSGLILGALGVWMLFPTSGWVEFLVSVFTGGILSGFVFAYWVPQNIKNVIPEEPKDQ